MLPYKMKGIIGGMLMLLAIMTSALLSFSTWATAKAMIIWYPHKGTIPMNNPKPTLDAFTEAFSSGLKMASRKFLLKFFF